MEDGRGCARSCRAFCPERQAFCFSFSTASEMYFFVAEFRVGYINFQQTRELERERRQEED